MTLDVKVGVVAVVDVIEDEVLYVDDNDNDVVDVIVVKSKLFEYGALL